ncbi:uncharacterized protein N7482_007518 [Penicillium canariense]|uniref:Uncharacterized protein n=1 Tax=Penicillium canariense TaxID=189055 RepID=A0A9W9HWX5_9EURO|nr:uncharacterized protein N7482_007518 [Penicillium canariense]KAJ5160514.1 hypothetical protein N7482_007518 [Penicillium canariense]
MKLLILAPLGALLSVAMADIPDPNNPQGMTPCLLKLFLTQGYLISFLATSKQLRSDTFVLALNTCLSARCDAADVKMSKDLHVKICGGTPV